MNGNDLPDKDLPVAERIAYLITGFLRGTLTDAEHNELDAWVVASDENTRLFEQLTDESTIEAGLRWQERLDEHNAYDKVRGRIGKKPARRLWLVGLAACFVIIAAGIFIYTRTSSDPALLIVDGTKQKAERHQAVLTLGGGRTIILDSAGSGPIASEGGVQIEKRAGGELLYQGTANAVLYHTLSTPRGGQYRMLLGDGTRVWLNAQSSLRFPSGFGKDSRKVELEGEAYFEVAKDAQKPFRVTVRPRSSNPQMVEVLGTHFNISGYVDSAVRTTLLEGSVRVRQSGGAVMLKPGQEAFGSGNRLLMRSGDLIGAVAWKEGLFRFRNAPIQEIVAQLERWYDIEVELRGNIPDHFTATIDRKESLGDVLRVLEETHGMRFTLTGRKLIIQP